MIFSLGSITAVLREQYIQFPLSPESFYATRSSSGRPRTANQKKQASGNKPRPEASPQRGRQKLKLLADP
jgi:hypothetical protein